MEIQTPQTIWNDYDKSGSVNESVVSQSDCGDYTLFQVYFNGEQVTDGVTRIFARLYRPKKEGAVPAVLFFDDENDSLGFEHIKVLLDEGFAVLWVDYLGKRAGKSRFTLYPDSLVSREQEGEETKSLPENYMESRFYVNGCVGFKALNYLLSKDFVDKDRIGALGVGEGGPIVWTLSVRERLRAGMTFYGGGVLSDDYHSDPKYLFYKAALDVRSYAQYSLFPILIQGASNERNNSLDYLSEMYNNAQSSVLSIAPRAIRAVITAQKKNLKYWFSNALKGSGYVPVPPEINARESDGKLYYDLEINESREVEDVKLFTYQGEDEAAFRNWSGQRIEKVSKGKYIAMVDVYTENEPIRAFVSVKYADSLYLSSAVLLKYPEQMNVTALPKRSRLIYDSDEMGLDDFIVPNDYDLKYDEEKLVVRKGPFDIKGVCSMTGQLATFKLGDHKFKGEGDSLLKLLMHVEESCSVVFSVMNKERDVFECIKELSPDDGWVSVSLAPFDFRSKKSVLSDWSDIVVISITSGNTKLLLSSMLWV